MIESKMADYKQNNSTLSHYHCRRIRDLPHRDPQGQPRQVSVYQISHQFLTRDYHQTVVQPSLDFQKLAP